MIIFVGNKPFKKFVRDAVTEVEGEFATISDLKAKIKSLKEEAADAKLEKRIEEEELKALVKVKEEKLKIESERRELDLQKKFNSKEMDLLKKYHSDMLGAIESQRQESKELYTAVMKRLPDVNVEINKTV